MSYQHTIIACQRCYDLIRAGSGRDQTWSIQNAALTALDNERTSLDLTLVHPEKLLCVEAPQDFQLFLVRDVKSKVNQAIDACTKRCNGTAPLIEIIFNTRLPKQGEEHGTA